MQAKYFIFKNNLNLVTIILTAIGLSVDGFAISVAYGTAVKEKRVKVALKLSIIFGIFHVIMPILGYLAGVSIKKYIETFDHWIAFAILAIIGIKMIIDDLKSSDNEEKMNYSTKIFVLLYLALATSIDALTVGLSFSLIGNSLLQFALIIGASALLFSFCGVWFGAFISKKSNLKVQILGGLILLYIGTKILIEHIIAHG